jgi:SAM-dependent methyltransferase
LPVLDTIAVRCPVCNGGSDETFMDVRGYRVARCVACGFLFVNPRPTPEALAALYAGANPYHGEEFEPTAGERPVLTRLVAGIRRRARGNRFLEVGCGRGDLLRAAAAAGFAVSGCDYFGADRPAIEGASFHDGALHDARLPAASFDVVVSRNTLEHLFDPRGELREMVRVLKPGGLLYLKVPNVAYETGWLSRLVFREPHKLEPPYHLNYFRAASLRRFLATAGLRLDRWSLERPSRERSWKANLAREAYFRASLALASVSGGRVFPRIILACFATHQPMP